MNRLNAVFPLTRLSLLCVAAVGLSACVTTKTVPVGAEPAAAKTPSAVSVAAGSAQSASAPDVRASARWNALIKRDFAAAYQFLTPGYRATNPEAQYVDTLRNRPVQWEKQSFVDKDCASVDVCSVRMSVGIAFEVPSVGKQTADSFVEEKWLLIDGQWYFLPTSAPGIPGKWGIAHILPLKYSA